MKSATSSWQVKIQCVKVASAVVFQDQQRAKRGQLKLLEGARRRGYDFEFLAKPLHPEELLTRIEKLIGPRMPAINLAGDEAKGMVAGPKRTGSEARFCRAGRCR